MVGVRGKLKVDDVERRLARFSSSTYIPGRESRRNFVQGNQDGIEVSESIASEEELPPKPVGKQQYIASQNTVMKKLDDPDTFWHEQLGIVIRWDESDGEVVQSDGMRFAECFKQTNVFFNRLTFDISLHHDAYERT